MQIKAKLYKWDIMLRETRQGTDSSQSTGKVKAGRTGDRSARKFEVSLGYCLPDPKFKKKKVMGREAKFCSANMCL